MRTNSNSVRICRLMPQSFTSPLEARACFRQATSDPRPELSNCSTEVRSNINLGFSSIIGVTSFSNARLFDELILSGNCTMVIPSTRSAFSNIRPSPLLAIYFTTQAYGEGTGHECLGHRYDGIWRILEWQTIGPSAST